MCDTSDHCTGQLLRYDLINSVLTQRKQIVTQTSDRLE